MGFSAMLTPDQAQKLAESDSVVSVFKSTMHKLHTTHSWQFLGVDSIQQYNQLVRAAKSNIIVGVIDTGVWPESQSFNDYGLGPMPEKFKGECVIGDAFTLSNCNRKIIGARLYSKGFELVNGPLESFNRTFFRSSRDSDGHRAHIASTVAGSLACWFELCNDADVLSAFDDAINDGVDILSLSFGPMPPQPSFFQEVNSIGTFHAFQKGILVSASAGNSFLLRTACNVAPWILTIGASTMDRKLQSDIYLGNSKIIKLGVVPQLAPGIPPQNASFCKNNTLDPTLIKGKIVVCTTELLTDIRAEKAIFVKQGGGVGMILIDPVAKDVIFQFVIHGSVIYPEAAEELQAYMATEKDPVAKILPHRQFYLPSPHQGCLGSLQWPDITAPGVNILAAWSPVATGVTAGRTLDYNIIYATVLDNTQNFIKRNPNGASTTPFDYGSRHINPVAAMDPGLVYDFDSSDIVDFLCSTGASLTQLKKFTGKLTYCKNPPKPSHDFNYPSIGVSNMNGGLSVHRTVTYYGEGPTIYCAQLEYPSNVNAKVIPNELKFTKFGEKMSFRIDFTPYKSSNGSFVFGALTWFNGIHRVRSPIALNVVSAGE
ncbi:unnamed protein product [Ilex paraguariensis]|uniref:Uncharacterized protein n=1 Tax=Ilex paraguariensis TaxID=185542 RepID=A0ABC8UCI6_9AQUA